MLTFSYGRHKPPLGAMPSQALRRYQGTIGHWLFNESAGATVYDASGNRRNGTFQSGPLWTIGRFGPALDFAGGTNDYISVSSTFGTPAAVSCAAWLKQDTAVNDNDLMTCDSDAFTLRPTHGGAGGNPAYYIKTSVTFYGVDAASYPGTGVWYHLAGTYDGVVTIKLYINGLLIGTNTSVTGTLATWSTVYLGRHTSTTRFDGMAEDLRIWNRALTEAEVWSLYVEPFAEFSRPRRDLYAASAYVAAATRYPHRQILSGVG